MQKRAQESEGASPFWSLRIANIPPTTARESVTGFIRLHVICHRANFETPAALGAGGKNALPLAFDVLLCGFRLHDPYRPRLLTRPDNRDRCYLNHNLRPSEAGYRYQRASGKVACEYFSANFHEAIAMPNIENENRHRDDVA